MRVPQVRLYLLQKGAQRRVEIALFTLVILMLGYAWFVHFLYGAILNRTNEEFEHAVFWSILYPVSIFLLCIFFGKRLEFSKSTEYLRFIAFPIISLLLCIGMWDWLVRFPEFWDLFFPAFWIFLAITLFALACLLMLIQLRLTKNKGLIKTSFM